MTTPNLCTQAWARREEILYPALFGRNYRGILPIQPDMFTATFGQTEVDPNWTRCGVFEFAPTEKRASFLYVTSGMSNAWDGQPWEGDGRSGLGCEFVLETPFQAPWAVTRLHYLMAYQLLVAHGRYPGGKLLQDYAQIPLGTPIGTKESALTVLMLAPPAGFLRRHDGQTGWFDFFQVVGITESEAAAARQHGGLPLVQALMREGAFPVTVSRRSAVA